MPKKVDHQQRREAIAVALWNVVRQRGITNTAMRDVAREANISLGQLQHYFSTRTAMLTFAMDFAAEQRAQRVHKGRQRLGESPHPRDVLRLTLTEMLPVHRDARATSRMSAAYVLEALHDNELHVRARKGLLQGRAAVERVIRAAIEAGQIGADRDPVAETDLLLALTGFSTLLELKVISPRAALTAIDKHLDRLFTLPS